MTRICTVKIRVPDGEMPIPYPNDSSFVTENGKSRTGTFTFVETEYRADEDGNMLSRWMVFRRDNYGRGNGRMKYRA